MISGTRKRVFFTAMGILSFLVFALHLFSYSQSSRSRIRTKKVERFTFLAIGDFGGTGRKPFSTRTQRQVANAMAKEAGLHNVSTIVGLGDNFYPHGVRNVHDSRFQSTFEDVYSAHALMKARWLMMAGNHDHEGNVTAQIQYSRKSHRWFFPNLYYTQVFRISDSSKVSLQIVVIDTKLLCSKSHKNKKEEFPSKDEHRQWVEKTIRNSKSEYLIVAGHNPIFSAGKHGGLPCLLSFLKPLLDEYDVTAYVSGHDHNFQHIQDKRMNYFISGNGNYYDTGNPSRRSLLGNSLKIIYGASGGFTMFTASISSLQVTHKNAKGQYIYRTELSPRRTVI